MGRHTRHAAGVRRRRARPADELHRLWARDYLAYLDARVLLLGACAATAQVGHAGSGARGRRTYCLHNQFLYQKILGIVPLTGLCIYLSICTQSHRFRTYASVCQATGEIYCGTQSPTRPQAVVTCALSALLAAAPAAVDETSTLLWRELWGGPVREAPPPTHLWPATPTASHSEILVAIYLLCIACEK